METIYNAIGTGYNTTRRADPYLVNRLFHHLNPEPDGLYLDIGCGTGNYTTALADKGLNFTGVEPSEKMLIEARNKSEIINWLEGTAENNPADDAEFNGVIATLTIHHWVDLERSFKEIYRVTKENGRIVFFTATPTQMNGYWLNHYFPKMLRSSIDQMPAFEVINDALRAAGFNIITTEKYFISDDLKDMFLYSGKHNPKLYFNEDVRKGISSFAALASIEEVNAGLLQLQADLDSGYFKTVRNIYENDFGDYLFLVAKK
jgi:SAM-dependent methyltransferase